MELDQIYNLVNSGSYFSRSDDEVTAAINAAARFLYDWILKENRGYWIKWDMTTVALVANQEEYSLPTDLQNLLRMRERPDAFSDWAVMDPASGLTDPNMVASLGSNDVIVADGPVSQFTYLGPYLDAAAAQAKPQGAKKVRVGPIPQNARLVELVYTVKFVEIVDQSSYLFIPDEGSGRYALLDLAKAELLDLNDDSMADRLRNSGMQKLTLFLQTVRDQQLQQAATQRPYLDDLD